MLLDQVIRAIQPIQVLGHINQSVSIDYLLTDSRQLNTTPQNTLSRQWKTDVEKLNICFDRAEIIDGSNPKWKKIVLLFNFFVIIYILSIYI